MQNKINYLIGIDGGGTGTRVIICDLNLKTLATGDGPPCALSLGIDRAWRSIVDTIANAFYQAGISIPMLSECAIGLGLSGANNIHWKNEFLFKNPGFKKIEVDTDGYTTLIGAHGGKPGTIVALGTGSIGLTINNKFERKYVSGWGFPSGDEASGSFLGMRAVKIAEKKLDGRITTSLLADKILNAIGNNPDDLLKWLSEANQNKFATLAPYVFETSTTDQLARDLLLEAGNEVALMFKTLDPISEYPMALCGRLGQALIPYLNSELQKKLTPPQNDSTFGALQLVADKI